MADDGDDLDLEQGPPVLNKAQTANPQGVPRKKASGIHDAGNPLLRSAGEQYEDKGQKSRSDAFKMKSRTNVNKSGNDPALGNSSRSDTQNSKRSNKNNTTASMQNN